MKKISFKICMSLFSIVSLIILLMICPWFNITKTEIKGLENIQEQKIYTDLKLKGDKPVNLFAFNSFKAKKILLSNPYAESVKIIKHFPNVLEISIAERKITGYIPYMGQYLYIDGDGRIIDVQSAFTKKLPVVVGLNFTKFTLGEILEVENKDTFDIVVELSKLITKYELLDDIIRVDVSDSYNIHLYVNNIDVIFGSFEDSNWKISTLNEIIKKMSPEDKGFLDITDSSKKPLFTYLT